MSTTRDLLLVIGFLRSGQMYPAALPLKALGAHRSLKLVHDTMSEEEQAMFGKLSRPIDDRDVKRRVAITSWSGELLAVGTRIEEVSDPGVLLCLFYDCPVDGASLPIDVFAQTLRRFALRDKTLRAKFDDHLENAGTYVPAWLSPEVRRKKSQEQFDAAMKVAREQGFASAAPLFEGVRGECFAEAQLAITVYETRELGNIAGALLRLGEVVRIAPRNVAARMQRAALYRRDSGRQIEAAADYLAALRLSMRPLPGEEPSREVKAAAVEGLWELHREFADPKAFAVAKALVEQDAERGFDALSRYVHTHPCTWDAQVELARLALARQRFDLAAKLLKDVRWLYPEDPGPHFVYGQALAASGLHEAALRALEFAQRLAPSDVDVRNWVRFSRKELVSEDAEDGPASVAVAHHVARSLLVLRGVVWKGRVYPTATQLHKVPGDVAMAFVLQAAAGQDQRPQAGGEAEVELRRLAERAEMSDYHGDTLSPDNTLGDVADPGVVIVILYESAPRNAEGVLALDPPPAECRTRLLNLIAHDAELSLKVDRHLKSPDASLKARLEL